MTYAQIDDLLQAWSRAKRIPCVTRDRDYDVRSFDVFGANRSQYYQIWVDPPGADGVHLHAWDYKKWRVDVVSAPSAVPMALDALCERIAAHDASRAE